MKIAIHNSPNSFAQEWIAYCEAAKIEFSVVNCYEVDIIEKLKSFDGLMWHFHHMAVKDIVMARSLLHSLQHADYPTFPDYETMWHFDDKIAQKYLMEALELPVVQSYTFYSKDDTMKWIDSSEFPKVFKLRGGAGSFNVKLVRNKSEARRLTRIMFSRGMNNYRSIENLQERFRLFKKGKIGWWSLMKGVFRLFKKPMYNRVIGREISYTYWQDFVPNNEGDFRVVVIGNKAFAIKRMNRENDFRASGSGVILYDKEHFENSLIRFAFNAAESLKMQCVGFDILNDGVNNYKIVEVSYGFSKAGYTDCSGYWDKQLRWYPEKFNPYQWMVDDFIKKMDTRN